MPSAAKNLPLSTQRAKDLVRSIDDLETRPDIAQDTLGCLGVSMGAAEGAIYTTLAQDRLRTAVFFDGGFFLDEATKGADQADFAPRMKKPVLMVNGRYDATLSYEESQWPLFRMLCTPAVEKKHVVLQTPHDVSTERSSLVHEVLTWLDKHLGSVEQHRRGVRVNAPFQELLFKGVRDIETKLFHAHYTARFKSSDPLKRTKFVQMSRRGSRSLSP